MKSRLWVFSVVLLSIVMHTVMAGDRSNIRGVGMGRTMNAASRNTDAIGINPANIAIRDIGKFTLSLAPTGFMMNTELFSYDLYKNYFTGVPGPDGKRVAKVLTEEDMNNILSQIPDLPLTKIRLESMIFGISFQHPVVGGIGFAVIEHAGATIGVSRDFFRMAAFGLDSSGSQYTFYGTGFSAWWYREYNLSYGRRLPVKVRFLRSLYAGIGIKFIRGYGIYQTDYNRSSFGNYVDPSNPSQYSLKGNMDFLATHAGADFFHENSGASFSFLPDAIGKGTGVDIGVTGVLKKGIHVALSVTDIGSITWDKNVIKSVGNSSINVQGVFGAVGDTLKDALKGSTRPGVSFSTSLPTTFRLGATIQSDSIKFLPRKMLLAFDYVQGLNNSLGNTTKPRFSLGIEYRIIPYVPLRTGIVVGGDDKVRWAFGFGFNLRYFNLDFATEHFGMFFVPKSFQMVSISMGIKIRV